MCYSEFDDTMDAIGWLTLQTNFELAQALKRKQPRVKPLDDAG